MWILLIGLAAAEGPSSDWAVPTHFPEPELELQAPPPPKPPSARQVGNGILQTFAVIGAFCTIGFVVAPLADDVRP